MKTSFWVIVLSLAAFTCPGQGTVGYQNTAGAGKEKYIYAINWSYPTSGNLSPPFGIDRDKLMGNGFSAQLFWGAADSSEADLKPVEGSLTGFKSGTTGGLINGYSKLPIPGTHGGDKVTLQLRAWDNRVGTVTSWDQVWALRYELPHGASKLILNYELAGLDADGVSHVGSGNLATAGLEGFGLHLQIPEPCTTAMAAAGILTLLTLRSRRGHRDVEV